MSTGMTVSPMRSESVGRNTESTEDGRLHRASLLNRLMRYRGDDRNIKTITVAVERK